MARVAWLGEVEARLGAALLLLRLLHDGDLLGGHGRLDSGLGHCEGHERSFPILLLELFLLRVVARVSVSRWRGRIAARFRRRARGRRRAHLLLGDNRDRLLDSSLGALSVDRSALVCRLALAGLFVLRPSTALAVRELAFAVDRLDVGHRVVGRERLDVHGFA